MSIFVRVHRVVPDMTFHDISSQDLDGSGGIGFDEVCRCRPRLNVLKLTCRIQFVPLWNYIAVRVPQQTSPLSDLTVVNSNGGKCLLLLTPTGMVELMQMSWDGRWPTTSTLACERSGFLSLTLPAQPPGWPNHHRQANEQIR